MAHGGGLLWGLMSVLAPAAGTSHELSGQRDGDVRVEGCDGERLVALQPDRGIFGVCNLEVGQAFGMAGADAVLRGNRQRLVEAEAVSGDRQGGVVLHSWPAPSLVVAQAQFLVELAVVVLDQPPEFGQINQALEAGIGGQVGEPVRAGLALAFEPLDQQPDLGPGHRDLHLVSQQR